MMNYHVKTEARIGYAQQFGQFMTPPAVAQLMAELFTPNAQEDCRLLDAGAGQGQLSLAFLERCAREEQRRPGLGFRRVQVTAHEVDAGLFTALERRLHEAQSRLQSASSGRVSVDVQAILGDFLLQPFPLASDGHAACLHGYTHVILNPPWRKLHRASMQRRALEKHGLPACTNLYTAFAARALQQMAPGGQMVAILPRSFCTGAYHLPFRRFLLSRCALHHVHVFDLRRQVFEGVTQECVIVHLQAGARQEAVTVTACRDARLEAVRSRRFAFEEIVSAQDGQRFIRIPVPSGSQRLQSSARPAPLSADFAPAAPAVSSASSMAHPAANFSCRLSDLGVRVFTGPVVAFRARPFLREAAPALHELEQWAPLLHAHHIRDALIDLPANSGGMSGARLQNKPLAIARNEQTQKSLRPAGFYCVLKRITSKEQRRRLVAGVLDPQRLLSGLKGHAGHGICSGASGGCADSLATAPVPELFIGFENHLNVLCLGDGRDPRAADLAYGLCAFFNSTAAEEQFRQFGSSTQVNAGDLKQMRYPSLPALLRLGAWMRANWSQAVAADGQAALDCALARLA